MHQLPLDLYQASTGIVTYDKVLTTLQERARQKGPQFAQWLASKIENLQNR